MGLEIIVIFVEINQYVVMKSIMRLFVSLVLLSVCSCIYAQQEVRNVIYMIGDGMGLAHMSMFEIESGYADNAFKRAERVALVSTMSANNRVTDSAAAGTALSSGEKTNNAMIGVRPDGTAMTSMMEMAVEKGFATGIVVTSELYHATPAAFYAHQPSRKMFKEIASDMLESDIDVLIGGGDLVLKQPVDNRSYLDHFAQKDYVVAHDMATLENVESGKVIAVLSEKSMPAAVERGDYLPSAVSAALKILENNSKGNDKGFMLMVEGSKIDGAAHANKADDLLAETADFEKAVGLAMDYADAHPGTLVVVVADHETGGLTMPSGNSDFTSSESGLLYKFSTGSHTGIRVPAYLYGAGIEGFKAMMDNTEVARSIMDAADLR